MCCSQVGFNEGIWYYNLDVLLLQQIHIGTYLPKQIKFESLMSFMYRYASIRDVLSLESRRVLSLHVLSDICIDIPQGSDCLVTSRGLT